MKEDPSSIDRKKPTRVREQKSEAMKMAKQPIMMKIGVVMQDIFKVGGKTKWLSIQVFGCLCFINLDGQPDIVTWLPIIFP